jgi:DNA polymerase-3 subunit alpha (Gram-positive type)
LYIEIEPDKARLHALLCQAINPKAAEMLTSQLRLKKLAVDCQQNRWQFFFATVVPELSADVKACLEEFAAFLKEKVPALGDVRWQVEDDEVAYMERLAERIRQAPPEPPKNPGQQEVKKSFGKKRITGEPMQIKEIAAPGQGVICGRILRVEERETRSGKTILIWDLYDGTDSITCKAFLDKEPFSLKKGEYVKVAGKVEDDSYSGELVMLADSVLQQEPPKGREDNAPRKRIELHLHTKMSAMDATCDVKAAIAQAASWGHSAIAITDHGVVQAFPDAYEAGKKHGIKVLFGMEAYLVNDGKGQSSAEGLDVPLADSEFVVFDLETTGFSPLSCSIIELGAVRVRADGTILDEFNTFVGTTKSVDSRITKLTGITDEMLADAPPLEDVIPRFVEFAQGAVLAAHNASFDLGFLRHAFLKLGLEMPDYHVTDTLLLARALCPELKNHKLDTLAKEFKVELLSHHRACDDAKATAGILAALLGLAEKRGVKTLADLDKLPQEQNLDRLPTHHAIILVKSQQGMENLYRLVSSSHINHFYRNPRVLKSELERYREGLILGSACESGELYRAILAGESSHRIREIASFYDFLEIQPLGNNEFLLRSGTIGSREELQKINQTIYELGKELNKPVVATGDVHFLEPSDAVFREILQTSQGYDEADKQAPLFLRTTEEMLGEFSYLGSDAAEEVVITNPQLVASWVDDDVKPMLDGLHTPKIEGAEEEIRTMTMNRARELYGDPLPEIVSQRLQKELDSIINNGFAVLYLIAHKLVDKSLSDGYLVGSRGSVGSSLVATMCGITEVNPLPAHYLCPKCKYSEFITDGSVGAGADLPAKDCPRCGTALAKDGHDIPFEVFMGFEGDKVPDIDLNFSGEYQHVVHKYTEELFGKGHVYRAGTIGTLADRTAYGMVKKYAEERGLKLRSAEIQRLVDGCTGVKRTTGQHPGGVMVVPRNKDIHQFCPIQFPANDKNSATMTTHFDYSSISDRLVKLDILGHDDPTVIRMLQDLTGTDPLAIPLDEPKTMSLFSSLESLGISPEDAGDSQVGTLAIPEFGTRFVRQMLEDVRPKSFSELVRISGFSHGTDVWLNNAQDLIRQGIAEAKDCISTRDDIMSFLIYKGVEPSRAFAIMEKVRKGKGLAQEDEELLTGHKIPRWFIDSCKKIRYLFPKAHAVAYVTMAFRIAFYKVYYPTAFYASYFTVRAQGEFNIDPVLEGPGYMKKIISEINQKGNEATQKEKNLASILEVAVEAVARGIKFLPVDLYRSHPQNFLIVDEGKLLPPLSSLEGLGINAAKAIADEREKGEFKSIEDLRQRARLSKNVIDVLGQHGALAGLPETNQLSLFQLAN